MRRSGRLPLLVVLLACLASSGATLAGSISLAWDPVPDTDVAGYKVYYGTAPDTYDQVKDVGNVTSTTLTGLDACTRYYIAVKAYDSGGLESTGYSNQIDGLPRPVVSSSNPASGEQGQSLTLAVGGESFVDGATVEFSGSGITVQSVSYVSCNELSVAIAIAAGASVGVRDITVVNPDQSFGTGTGIFTVTANQAPTVTGTNPAAGAQDVPVTVRPVVTFSEAMDPASITASTVRLLDASGAAVAQAAGSPQLSANHLEATITPAADLDNAATYRIWVDGGAGGVRDEVGKEMAADWEQSPGFTTVASSDTQGPQVTATDPAAGATDVPVGVHPTVTFDEAVDAATVTPQTVMLLDASGAQVAQAAGSPALAADGRTATITPAVALAENSTYRIRVVGGSSGVKDLAGNPMDQTFTQTPGFTTENLPPSTVTNLRRTDVK